MAEALCVPPRETESNPTCTLSNAFEDTCTVFLVTAKRALDACMRPYKNVVGVPFPLKRAPMVCTLYGGFASSNTWIFQSRENHLPSIQKKKGIPLYRYIDRYTLGRIWWFLQVRDRMPPMPLACVHPTPSNYGGKSNSVLSSNRRCAQKTEFSFQTRRLRSSWNRVPLGAGRHISCNAVTLHVHDHFESYKPIVFGVVVSGLCTEVVG